MAPNVVEILVKASDETGAGFGEAKASAVSSADEIAAAQDKVTAAENKLRDAEIRQTDAQLKLQELQQSGKASAEEMAAAQDKVTQATIRAADAQIRLGEADARLALAEKGAGDAAVVQAEKSAGMFTKVGAGLKGLGAGLGSLGSLADLALAGVGYEAVKMSMNFQAAMERLVTQAGVPQKELGGLKQGILSLAGTVGFDPNSLAVSLYHVASNMQSLGATAPQMLNAVKIAAEGARVGGANLEDVTNALTAAIASGIPGVQDYSQAMGALNAIVGAGDMKMQDLAEAMGTGVVAVVKGYGLSLKDVGAALATFGDNNIRGANAATDLRMAVMALAVPAAAGKKVLAEMGLSMTDLSTTMRQHGLLAALEELQAHFKAAGVTAKEQGDVITQIFGKKAGTGLNVLMDQMDRLKSKYPDITKGADNFGDAWKKTGQTLSQQWDQLRSQFGAMLIQLGEKLIPVLSAIASFLNRNKGIIESLAPVVMAVVGAFLALKVAMTAISAVTSLGPWGIALMAIVAATVLVIEHWKQIKQVAEDVWHAVAAAVTTAWDAIYNAIAGPVKAVVDFVESHWKLLIAIILGPLGLVIDALVTHWNAVKHGFEAVWNFVRRVTEAFWDGFLKPYIMIQVHAIEAILSWFGKLASLFRGWFAAAANAVSDEIGKLIRFVEQIPGRINSALGGLPGMLFRAGVNAILGLIHGIESMFGAIGNVVSNVAHKVAGFFGLSPAKEGPLSGGGAPEIRGQHFAADLARGMLSGQSSIASAAQRLAGSAAIGPGGAGGAGGYGGAAAAGTVVQLSVGTGSGLDQMFLTWLRQQIRVKGGNVQLVLGHG